MIIQSNQKVIENMMDDVLDEDSTEFTITNTNGN